MSPRNSSGSYSLPTPGNPIVSGSVTNSTTMNATLADLGNELGSSLDRAGRGGMLSSLRTIDGTVAAPAHAFTAEPGTGFWRSAAGEVAIAILGVLGFKFTAAGMQVSGANPILRSVDAHAAISLQGNQAAADPGTDTALSSVAVRTAGDLTQIQNAGNAQLAVNYQGLVRLINQAGALQPASIWTAITTTSGWVAGNGLACFKDSNGMVHVKGTATSPSSPTLTPFTLPAGFRPAPGTTRYFPLVNTTAGVINTMLAIVDTGATGIGGTLANSAVYSFDSIHFIAES